MCVVIVMNERAQLSQQGSQVQKPKKPQYTGQYRKHKQKRKH